MHAVLKGRFHHEDAKTQKIKLMKFNYLRLCAFAVKRNSGL
jgi:hypothetical protein